MEELREKLYRYMAEYGVNDLRTIAVSKALDSYVVEEQKIKY